MMNCTPLQRNSHPKLTSISSIAVIAQSLEPDESNVIGTTSDVSDIIKTIQEAFQTTEEGSYLQDLLIKDPLFMIPWPLISRALIALTEKHDIKLPYS